MSRSGFVASHGWRAASEWAAVAVGLAVSGYLGWDGALWDARLGLLLHLAAAGAIGWLVAHAVRGGALPRTPIDAPVLALLAAFALATVLAMNVGMSLRSLAAVVAAALMLPVALLALRHRPMATATIVCLPVLGLSAITFGAMLARRVAWIIAGAPGLPPLRLPEETTPFGSVAVAPFILLGCWVIAGAMDDARWRRRVRVAVVGVGLPFTVLSGSRSAWVAIGVAAAILAVPWAWHRRRMLGMPIASARGIVRAVAVVAVVIVVAVVAAPRVTALGSILYREALWRDTLTAWSASPLTGLGPGIMPWAREAAAADLSFPVGQPHSHNLAIGVLGDTGIVGLIAAIVVVIALLRVAGPWRCRTFTGQSAAAALLGIGVSGLFEDLTFLPNFNLVVILLVAMALADAGAVEWRPLRRPAIAVTALGALGAVLLGLAWVVADAGAIAYRAGIDSSAAGDWPAAAAAFEASVAIDPWQPAGPDALGVALAATGQRERARDALEAAVRLAPGNGRAWANLSVICGQLGDDSCQLDSAREAVTAARLRDPSLVIAAIALEELGYLDEADAAYRRSLLTNPATAFATEWPRTVTIGDGRIEGFARPVSALGVLLAKAAMGEPVVPADYEADAVRALAFAHAGREEAAREALADAHRHTPSSLLTWEIDLALRRAWDEPVTTSATIYRILNGWPVAAADEPELARTGLLNEIASFRSFPSNGLVPGAEDLAVVPPYPWFLGALVPEESAGER